MATRIAIMSGGKVLQTGAPREVYDLPANRFVANFVGDTNFLEGTVRRSDGRPVFELAGGSTVDAPGDASDGPATLMVRPEFLALRSIDAQDSGPAIRGRIVNIAFLGNHTRITVATVAGDVVVVRPHGTRDPTTDTQRDLGEEVCVWWRAGNAALDPTSVQTRRRSTEWMN